MSKHRNAQAPAADRFCDLVMKGGVTSGIVYPRAVALLARHYRFHSIGGSSAGAIAATISAAAEYQRRQTNGSQAGFETLAQIPEQLGRPVPATGAGKLLSLLQPARGTRRLFLVLVNALNRASHTRRVLTVLAGMLKAYWPATLIALIVLALLWSLAGMPVAGVFAFVLLAGGLTAGWIYRDLSAGLVNNGFGLCRGMSEGDAGEALTPWLHRQIQQAAGRAASDPPMTFGDLRHAPGAPSTLAGPGDEGELAHSINLQLYATNLSHGRPYVFPLDAAMAGGDQAQALDQLYFTAADLQPYLPADVLQWMIAHSTPYEAGADEQPSMAHAAQALGIRCLPEPDNLPLLFAARLSLSFPVLLSAVPLYAVNLNAAAAQPAFQRCWFSDGGISSNFPVHLFDALVPRWPTFGIDFERATPGAEAVYLPVRYEDGFGERWSAFGQPGAGATQLVRFAGAIASAMQNWTDNTLARMPGVRDRVVRVRLNSTEGGLNLNMSAALIDEVASRGEQAAELLVQRFADTPTGSDVRQLPGGWDQHRYVRLATLLQMLEARAPDLLHALRDDLHHALDFRQILLRYEQLGQQSPPTLAPGHQAPLSAAQAALLETRLALLERYCADMLAASGASGFKAIPQPELRVRPPV